MIKLAVAALTSHILVGCASFEPDVVRRPLEFPEQFLAVPKSSIHNFAGDTDAE